jgi:hypothetical protein
MRWELWAVGATLVVSSYGCPRTIMCAPGEVLVEGRCAFDCPPGSTSGCRDTGVNVDATADGGDAMPCPMGQTRCGAVCVDLQTSVDHCGRCDMTCRAPEAGTAMCSMGSCTLTCPSQTHECGGACVSNDAVESCGTRCEPCPVPAGSRALCTAQMCAFECLPGFERVGDACEARVPRPVFPPGTSTVSSHQPTLRWELGAGTDGAVVEVCRDRACTMRVAMFDATGTSARPSMALPASTVLFWRLRGRVGTIAGTRFSPTWQFRTRATSAASVDTAYGTELDINGDGFTDVAMGAPNTGSARGSVQLGLGGATGVSAVRTVTSPIDGGQFGARINPLGDINGDGFGDFSISAHLATGAGVTNAGCVFVYLGNMGGLVTAESSRLCGSQPMSFFGFSVAGGDGNGDGYSDVFVGSSGTMPSASRSEGSVSVYYGARGGLAPTPSETVYGSASHSYVGFSVSSGDTNGDRFADVVVAAPTSDGSRGVVLQFAGGSAGVSPAAVTLASGVLTGDLLGWAVDASGDLNGDGLADVVAGARAANVSGRGRAGVALTLLGSRSGALTASTTLAGAVAGDAFGNAVAIVRDTNGDGFDEVLVGAPLADPSALSSAGSAYLFRGSAMGAESTASLTVNGTVAMDSLGTAVGAHPDINGDGRGDFSIGAPAADPMSRNAAGIALVYFGAASPMLHRTFEGAAASDQLGTALATRSPGRSFGSPRSTLWCARR